MQRLRPLSLALRISLECVTLFVCIFLCGFFFFQAEDGIRDYKVTEFQTCALPISAPSRPVSMSSTESIPAATQAAAAATPMIRSEERRVGKECRSRGSPYQ